MFTIDQIKAAHSKVKSGADFPHYIQDLIQLGVSGYATYVTDSHAVYLGDNDFQITSDSKYTPLSIADKSDKLQFQKILKEHQMGQTNYLTFCQQSADLGVEKWVVNMAQMTCTYFDKAENELLTETIPLP